MLTANPLVLNHMTDKLHATQTSYIVFDSNKGGIGDEE